MTNNKFSLIINDYIFTIITIIFAYQVNNYFGFIGINLGDSFQTFEKNTFLICSPMVRQQFGCQLAAVKTNDKS